MRPVETSPASSAPPNRLYHEDGAWQASYGDETSILPPVDGVLYISYALERPGGIVEMESFIDADEAIDLVHVRDAVMYARQIIAKHHPALGRHLQRSFGCDLVSMIYNPPGPTRWHIRRPRVDGAGRFAMRRRGEK